MAAIPNPFPDSTTITLSTDELAESRYLRPLFDLCNIAFNNGHQRGVPGKTYFNGRGRFDRPEDLVDELRPGGFTLIMFEAGEDSNIIGTFSAKPLKDLTLEKIQSINHPRGLFKRLPAVKTTSTEAARELNSVVKESEGSDVVKWELLISAVAMSVKGKGVGSILMERCVEHIRTLSRGVYAERGQTGTPKLGLYLSTLAEVNEDYYVRKGWTTTAKKWFEPGTMQSQDGFHIVEMVKVVS